jgi:integrase
MLTNMAVTNAKPRTLAYKMADGKGLYLKVLKTGGKSWRYDYKIKNHNTQAIKNGTLVYGLYPNVGLAEARELHATAHRLVSQGIDPSEDKKEKKRKHWQERELKFVDVANEWLEKRKSEIKPATHSGIVKRLQNDVLPEIGEIPMVDLDAQDILRMLKRVESRGAVDMVKRIRQHCSQILKYGVAIGKAERDFTLDIRDALATQKTQHHPALEPHEIPELLRALERNEARLYPQTRMALEMLMLTFVRPIELASAEWDHIDFESKRWLIPAERMKMGFDHVVPLSSQVLKILQKMRVENGKRQYVFTKVTNPRDHMHRDTLSKAVRSLGFTGRHTAHGFRAMARTAIREKLEFDSEIIERQLAHSPSGSLGRAYDRTQFIEQRTKMMQGWADYLDEIGQHGTIIVGNFKENA